MSDTQFQSVNVKLAREMLLSLHEDVVLKKKRVELFDSIFGEVSVIISKEELDSIEEALAILSNTQDVFKLRRMIESIAHVANNTPPIVESAPLATFPA